MSVYVQNFFSGGRRNGAGLELSVEKEQWSLNVSQDGKCGHICGFPVSLFSICLGIITEWASFGPLSQNMLAFCLVSQNRLCSVK